MLPLLARPHRRRASSLYALRSYFTDAVLSAIYSTQNNVTVGSGVVSQWDDARGATGFAPSLIGTGTAKPAYAVGADGIPTITFDGVDDLLTSGTSALFDVSGAKSIAVIAAGPQVASAAYLAAVSDGGTLVRFLGMQQTSGAGGVFRTVTNPGPSTVATSVVTVGTARRLLIASKDAAGGVAVDVPNQPRVTASGNSTGAGNNLFVIGGGTGVFSKPTIVASLLIARQVTAADIVQLQQFAASLNYTPV